VRSAIADPDARLGRESLTTAASLKMGDTMAMTADEVPSTADQGLAG
jgi:hypothetical protein